MRAIILLNINFLFFYMYNVSFKMYAFERWCNNTLFLSICFDKCFSLSQTQFKPALSQLHADLKSFEHHFEWLNRITRKQLHSSVPKLTDMISHIKSLINSLQRQVKCRNTHTSLWEWKKRFMYLYQKPIWWFWHFFMSCLCELSDDTSRGSPDTRPLSLTPTQSFLPLGGGSVLSGTPAAVQALLWLGLTSVPYS